MNKYLALILLGCSVICNAEILPPGQILQETVKVHEETSFQADLTISGTPFRYYQQVNPDGTKYTLMKPAGNSKAITSFLSNSQGRFEIIGKTAVRTDYLKMPEAPAPDYPVRKDKDTIILNGREVTKEMIGLESFALLEKLADKKGKAVIPGHEDKNISVKEITYHGKPCYLVTYQSPTQAGMRTSEVTIDRETFFTYHSRGFDVNGKLLDELTYNNIETNPAFPKGLFEVPPGTKAIIAQTQEEGFEQSRMAVEKLHTRNKNTARKANRPSWISSAADSVSHAFWNNTTSISCIFAAIAVGLLIIIGIAKVKGKM